MILEVQLLKLNIWLLRFGKLTENIVIWEIQTLAALSKISENDTIYVITKFNSFKFIKVTEIATIYAVPQYELN